MFTNMDDECRAVRQRRKQSDPTCCPVCGITVRSHEIEQHFSLEVDRLHKLSIHRNKKQGAPSTSVVTATKEMPSITSTSVAGCSSAATTSSTNDTNAIDAKECWNTYQRIKNNRSARLKVLIILNSHDYKFSYIHNSVFKFFNLSLVEESKAKSRRSIVSGMQ